MFTSRLDQLSRVWWRLLGDPVDLTSQHAWLDAPMAKSGQVGDSWLRDLATERGGKLRTADGQGLIESMESLNGPGFSATSVAPEVREFYEHTSEWRMEVWAQWNPVFQPVGQAIADMFGRRVQQLALPTRPLDVARGMTSQVTTVEAANGARIAAGWLRTLRATGEFVYSGSYGVRSLPGADRPSIHVAFPLEHGNLQVFLRPSVLPSGALRLDSKAGQFGEDGAYVVVKDHGTHAIRLPLHEEFTVFVDDDGVLRTDHQLNVWSLPVLRLHYKLTR